MEIKWLEDRKKYDGTQLAPLYNYLTHGVLGDSLVGWQGRCDVSTEHMIDGEDLRQNSSIAGDNMLHFVLELFGFPLLSAVSFQRLMGSLLIDQVRAFAQTPVELERRGDDLYWGNKKFNISIATCSQNSSLIHFGLNVTNEGTPVETCSLADFKIQDSQNFAQAYMEAVQAEFLSIKKASMKVRVF